MSIEEYINKIRIGEIKVKDIPKATLTEELLLELVKNENKQDIYESILKQIPTSLKTQKLCIEAIKNNGSEILYMPEEMITSDMKLSAVKNGGALVAYKYLSDKEIDDNIDMFLDAINNNVELYVKKIIAKDIDVNNLIYFPEKFLTEKLCMELVKNGYDLYYLPKEFRTPEIYMESVKANGINIIKVPKEMRTLEMNIEAVKHGGVRAIDDMSDEEVNAHLDMFIEAINNKQDFDDKRVPTQFWIEHKELLYQYLEYRPYGIASIDEQLINEDLLYKALEKTPNAMTFISPKVCKDNISRRIIDLLINKGITLPLELKDKLNDDDIKKAFQNNASNFRLLPKKELTEEVCIEVIKQHPSNIQEVPKEVRTTEMYMIALKSNEEIELRTARELHGINITKKRDMYNSKVGYQINENACEIIRNIPKELITEDLVKQVIISGPKALKYLPVEMIKKDDVIEELKNNPYLYEYVPDDLKEEVKEIVNTQSQDKNSNTEEMRNVIVIAGPGETAFGSEDITKLTENIKSDSRTTLCIGNGNDEINNIDIVNGLEEIAKDDRKTTVVIEMHGTVKENQFYFINGNSYISSKELFKMISSAWEENTKSIDVVVMSCHSGACLADKNILPRGSVIGAFSQGTESTPGTDVKKFVDSLSQDTEDFTAFHLMQKYMSVLEDRVPPEIGISGTDGTVQLDELLRESMGKQIDRNKILGIIGDDMSVDDMDDIMDKIETGKNEYNILAKEYGKALNICLINEFGDNLSDENFKSFQCSKKNMGDALGFLKNSYGWSSPSGRISAMNMITAKINDRTEEKIKNDAGKEV